MENVSDITTLMRSIMERLDRGEGSVERLMNDGSCTTDSTRRRRTSRTLGHRLKPIVEDARVFMDKAARHPGVIVRDAVKPGVGTQNEMTKSE